MFLWTTSASCIALHGLLSPQIRIRNRQLSCHLIAVHIKWSGWLSQTENYCTYFSPSAYFHFFKNADLILRSGCRTWRFSLEKHALLKLIMWAVLKAHLTRLDVANRISFLPHISAFFILVLETNHARCKLNLQVGLKIKIIKYLPCHYKWHARRSLFATHAACFHFYSSYFYMDKCLV